MDELQTVIIGGLITFIVHFSKEYLKINPLFIVAILSVILGALITYLRARGVDLDYYKGQAFTMFASAVTIYNVLKAFVDTSSKKDSGEDDPQ